MVECTHASVSSKRYVGSGEMAATIDIRPSTYNVHGLHERARRGTG